MHKLKYYEKKFGNLPVQGSKEWLEGRSQCFGGSEIGTVLGKSKYDTFEELKKKKIENTFDSSDITQWGKLFERVAKYYIRKEIGTIYEFGSIPHSMYPISYSPDGLILKDENLLLLEIKCPIMRGVHVIPEVYHHQVQTGMNTINVEGCLFYQFRFRRCLYGTHVFNCSYDRFYHKEFRKRCADKGAISYGYLWWDTGHQPIRDLALLDSMISEITCEPQYFIEEECPYATGSILQWKLFDVTCKEIQPDKTYLEKHSDEIWKKYAEYLK